MSERVMRALHIEKNGVPIYVQVRDQMLRLIGTGVLAPGEQMPTMRQLAVALKTDLNTIRHAYDELARSGAIVVVRARGTYVAERPAPAAARASAEQADKLAQRTIVRRRSRLKITRRVATTVITRPPDAARPASR